MGVRVIVGHTVRLVGATLGLLAAAGLCAGLVGACREVGGPFPGETMSPNSMGPLTSAGAAGSGGATGGMTTLPTGGMPTTTASGTGGSTTAATTAPGTTTMMGTTTAGGSSGSTSM